MLKQMLRRGPAFYICRPTTTLAGTKRNFSHAGRSCAPKCSQQSGEAAPNIRDLAKMAQLSVSDKEVEDWGNQIQEIVSWFGQLQMVDVEGVEPSLRAEVDSGNTLRVDEAVEFAKREELLHDAPDKDDLYFKVPRIS